jgi:hypothetical protein
LIGPSFILSLMVIFNFSVAIFLLLSLYTLFNKNQVTWYFVCPAQAVTWHRVAIIIWIILLSAYLRICGVSVSSIHYNQSCCLHINQRHQYIRLIWS